ncbi:MAG: hypothetical protein IT366_16655 [Candidatus Hydrogenedentes bacterium]|nr:hypothetical protein [Candidatus Hydrogenedentota bacterium]
MNFSSRLFAIACAWGLAIPLAASAQNVDITKSVVIRGSDDSVIGKAVTVLIEEVEKRSGTKFAETAAVPAGDAPAIVAVLARDLAKLNGKPAEGLTIPDKAEGYAIWQAGANNNQVWIAGHDPRGVMFGVGHLLRKLEMRPGKITLPAPLRYAGAPVDRIRGQQLGYRNANNTWDAWDEKQFDQHIRELIIFGNNAIELIPDFDATPKESPVMKMTATEMNEKLCHIIHSYGIDVWAWHALKGDVSDPKLAESELARSREVFKQLPVLDALFIPGGDPGDTLPKYLMPFMEKLAAVLHEVHPTCELWVSTQGFEDEDSEFFFNYLATEKPKWFTGVIFGPWAKMDLKEIRKHTPKEFRVRTYPDITHTVRCQYPVPRWDRVFAHTLGREPANPRPIAQAHIHNGELADSEGFVTYSDGVNDDVNKIIWSMVGWDPKADITEILKDYGRFFIGADFANETAEGLLGQEENWKGALADNKSVDKNLALWQGVEKRCDAKALKENWRLQQCLMRAYYDAYQKARLLAEMKAEKGAYNALAKAGEVGANDAMEAAIMALSTPDHNPPAPELKKRIEQLGQELFDSIGMQLHVEKYKASGAERGAILEGLDRPLNDRYWLQGHFLEIFHEKDEQVKLDRINKLINWEKPVPGTLYDDLGNGRKEPHLVIANKWEDDPGYVYTAQDEFQRDPRVPQDPGQLEPKADAPPAGTIPPRLSWLDQAQTLFRADLQMKYENLDPSTTYTLRAVYTGRFKSTMTLTADDKYEVHGPVKFTDPPEVVEFKIPAEATKDGTLELRWKKTEGRGPQVAEVWLIPNS